MARAVHGRLTAFKIVPDDFVESWFRVQEERTRRRCRGSRCDSRIATSDARLAASTPHVEHQQCHARRRAIITAPRFVVGFEMLSASYHEVAVRIPRGVGRRLGVAVGVRGFERRSSAYTQRAEARNRTGSGHLLLGSHRLAPFHFRGCGNGRGERIRTSGPCLPKAWWNANSAGFTNERGNPRPLQINELRQPGVRRV